MSFSDLISKAKSAVFEEEIKPTQTQQTPVLPNLTASSFAHAYVSPENVNSPMVIEDNSINNTVYTSLKNKTDFDTTLVGGRVKSLLDTLKDVPVSDNQKLEIVFKLGARDNVSPASIQSAMNDLITKLGSEQTKFDQAMQLEQSKIDGMQSDINNDNQKIKDLEAQIEEVRKHQTNTTASMFQKQNSVAQNKAMFKAAFDRRKQELEKDINHFNITQGQS